MFVCMENVEISSRIHELREKMIESGKQNGFLNSETIKYSQELDKLIYRQQTVKKVSYGSQTKSRLPRSSPNR
ncbi:aspartyl-phosphate phosphatase Spo0E family protein [Bacillus sp. MRMR6]|uniref:aspartyl-phosphate phosphatase Spo0E family protein n=1 Tax=Bacillus sp. MRMR6 TaxID=1928617 RepID=UPI0009512DBA|nr:aspartyl-phosphate phosphatase Spo0E family protein [Bacillus sp. MRMR6]OLS41131.1 hypothetical protein BTR25_04520 [Bacillus sp. MRMR6]